MASFCAWLRAQPHKRKIVIAGNHDLSLHGGSYAHTGQVWGHEGLGPPEQRDVGDDERLQVLHAGVNLFLARRAG